MDEILFPNKKVRPPADTASGDLFAPPPEPKKAAPKLPLPTLLVPHGKIGQPCQSGCGAVIYKVLQPSGKWAPINCAVPGGRVPSATEDGIGINHFIDCEHRDQFRRKR